MDNNGPLKIAKDHQRFRQIVKGRIRKDLRKFLTRGELIGKEGKHLVSIPVPGIDLPHFRYGDNNDQGVGQGEGEAGQQVDGDESGIGPGGTEPGHHLLEVEVSLEELADILGEELQLPRILPKGRHNITSLKDRYSSIRQSGPESLRHFKRTFRRALRRLIMSGAWDPTNPKMVFEWSDKLYRSWKTSPGRPPFSRRLPWPSSGWPLRLIRRAEPPNFRPSRPCATRCEERLLC